MFIELTSNNGYKYLKLTHNSVSTRADGSKTVKRNVILNIGPLYKFDDGLPNYLPRLRQSFKNGNPLIPKLLPFVNPPSIPNQTFGKAISYGDPHALSETKLFGHVLIEKYLEELGLTTFVRQYKHHSNIEFDILGFFRLLVYGRILNPQSKMATFMQNNEYFVSVTKDSYMFNMYDTLDFIKKFKHGMINKINKRLITKFNRTTKNIYYDLTNFFFEIENPDDDEEFDDGTIIKGIRKMGVSKENRKQPIVQMGLFMDDQGVPISIEMFPGNTLDHQTVIPALTSSIDNLVYSKYIFVADRGITNNQNSLHLLNQNKGYIVSKSIAKCSAVEKKWIYDSTDFICVSKDFKYKSKCFNRTAKDPLTDKDVTFTEKSVVYWSRKFYNREIAQYKSFLDFVNQYEKAPKNFRLSSNTSKLFRMLLKTDVINTKTGELINSKDIETLIDMDKVKRFESQMGFYQIVTSEIQMDDLEVIDTYKGLTKIENEFRIMKGTLDTRPIYVRTKEHIESHLIICMIALTIVRLMQNKIDKYKKENDIYRTNEKKRTWNMGLNADKLKCALNNWVVDTIDDDYYKICNTKTGDLPLILNAFGVKLEPKYYKLSELKQIKTSIEIF